MDFSPAAKENLKSDAIVRPSLTYWQDAWIRLRKNKIATFALCLIAFYTLMAIFAPMFSLG